MQDITVELAFANRSDAIGLIRELDDYLINLYPPDSNHLLDIEALMQPNIRFVLAFAQDKAVGCGAIRLEPAYAEVKRMYVEPACRGLGIGKRILNQLEHLAQQNGLATIRLETGVSQPEALALYERNGYFRRERFGDYPDDPLSLYYEKHLTP